MAHSVGWPLVSQKLLQRERWPGRVRGYDQISPLVRPGQEVLPDQPVFRLERRDLVEPTQAASRLSLSTTGSMELQAIQAARFPAATPASLTLPAGLHGRVVDLTRRGGIVIESRVALLQGKIGAGRQVAGVLTMWQGHSRESPPLVIPPGALLVVPGPLNFALLRQAQSSGIAGIIASSISLGDLEGFLRTDVIQLLDIPDSELAQSRLPDLTLLLTEGLGAIAMPTRIINLLSMYQGSIALLSGTTSLRYHLVPELLISLPSSQSGESPQDRHPNLALALGALVRICAGEEAGSIGVIDYFFVYEQKFPSGLYARALRIRREDGSLLMVPITHVQRIE
jgi:hypothetical protein